jgi:Predicted signal transduction protein with a C-terminal ATPase domain
MCVIGINNYITSRDMIYEVARKNVYEIVKIDNKILDSKLKMIKDSCWNILSDKNFIEKSSAVVLDNNNKIISMDNELTKVLDKYLSSRDISFVQLMTSHYNFGFSTSVGSNRKYIPYDAFVNSELYSTAVEADGKFEWFPTYDFSKMFKQRNSQNIKPDYEYMFSALQYMKTSSISFKNSHGTAETIENPILIINFSENVIQDIFKESIAMKHSYFFMITNEGQFVSSQDRNKIGKIEHFPWLGDITKKQSGQDVVMINNQRTLICYDTSKETGWISIIAIDYNKLLGDIISSIKINSIYIVIALTLIPILISYFVSDMISKPITKLSKAIKKTGEGDFSIKIPEERDAEFNSLIIKFNSMNEKIQKLIEENYEIKIKEKEAEINALNLQLNPHFMYNTLNLMNLKLIKSGQDEVSEIVMSLSSMLKFTARNKNSLVSFEQELDYLKGYIYIMSKRFEGRFKVEFDVDPEIYEYSIPKFLLQPFVENSILHGFESIKEGGILKIYCGIKCNMRIFTVEDNGKGMREEKILEIIEDRSNSVGINNVRKRIQIIYGEKYTFDIISKPLEGTKVTIGLPIT